MLSQRTGWMWLGRGRKPRTDKSHLIARARPVRTRLSLRPLDERILPSVTEFPLSAPNHGPAGITRGPDGNVWFTEVDAVNGNRIGRITPSGQIVEFATGITPGSQPFDIAAGPDGNLWFTETADRIGRITPAGQVTEFCDGNHGGQSTVRNRRRAGREHVVHRTARPQRLRRDRADHPGRRRHRIPHRTDAEQRAVRDHRRGRSQSLVHGTSRRRGTDHDGGRRHRIQDGDHARTSSPPGSRRARTATCGLPNSAARSVGLQPRAR